MSQMQKQMELTSANCRISMQQQQRMAATTETNKFDSIKTAAMQLFKQRTKDLSKLDLLIREGQILDQHHSQMKMLTVRLQQQRVFADADVESCTTSLMQRQSVLKEAEALVTATNAAQEKLTHVAKVSDDVKTATEKFIRSHTRSDAVNDIITGTMRLLGRKQGKDLRAVTKDLQQRVELLTNILSTINTNTYIVSHVITNSSPLITEIEGGACQVLFSGPATLVPLPLEAADNISHFVKMPTMAVVAKDRSQTESTLLQNIIKQENDSEQQNDVDTDMSAIDIQSLSHGMNATIKILLEAPDTYRSIAAYLSMQWDNLIEQCRVNNIHDNALKVCRAVLARNCAIIEDVASALQANKVLIAEMASAGEEQSRLHVALKEATHAKEEQEFFRNEELVPLIAALKQSVATQESKRKQQELRFAKLNDDLNVVLTAAPMLDEQISTLRASNTAQEIRSTVEVYKQRDTNETEIAALTSQTAVANALCERATQYCAVVLEPYDTTLGTTITALANMLQDPKLMPRSDFSAVPPVSLPPIEFDHYNRQQDDNECDTVASDDVVSLLPEQETLLNDFDSRIRQTLDNLKISFIAEEENIMQQKHYIDNQYAASVADICQRQPWLAEVVSTAVRDIDTQFEERGDDAHQSSSFITP